MKGDVSKTTFHSGWAIGLTLAVVVLWNLIGLKRPVVHLSENQSLYIYSSAAQVIAGIYGLTVAGYAFLRNQQDRKIDKDESLAEIFERIQVQQHSSVLFITAISGLAIFGSLMAIALREIDALFLGTISSNTATALFVTSLGWTAYFVVDVMRPEKILSASESIKQEIEKQENASKGAQPVSRNGSPPGTGHLERFLTSYNAIERFLEEYAERHFYGRYQNKTAIETTPTPPEYRGTRARWTMARIIKALAAQRVISKEFAEELLALVRYRNALVHGSDMTVEGPMVTKVERAIEKLDAELHMGGDPK